MAQGGDAAYFEDDQVETLDRTLVDARGVHATINALQELLQGCRPGHRVTASHMLGVVENVVPQLDNLMDGLQVLVHRARAVRPRRARCEAFP